MPQETKSPALPKGFAGSYDDAIGGSLDLNQLLVHHPSSTYFVRVDGDGMASEGTASGDIVVVDRGLTPDNGDLVIAVVDGEMVLRQLRDTGAERALVSGNGDTVTPIGEDSNIEFWGVVTASIRQYRKSL